MMERIFPLLVVFIAISGWGCGGDESESELQFSDVDVRGEARSVEPGEGGVPRVNAEPLNDTVEPNDEVQGEPVESVEDSGIGPEVDGEAPEGEGGQESVPPCPAHGLGFATLQGGSGGGGLLEYTEPVIVEAQHLEPGGCLTAITLTWTRNQGCALTLNFAPSLAGVWMLQDASLAPGEACGSGGAGLGTATLSEVPLTTASSPPPLRCTVLSTPIFVHGVVELSGDAGVSIDLDGLGVDGMLLSTAVDAGACGEPYMPCATQECGEDPLLALSCGGCAENAICENGSCKTVEPVIALCQRVLDDRADVSEGLWDGSVASCEPGVMSLDWQERALKSSNLYRWLVGQPPLTLSVESNPSLQECAVMMHAAGTLSHSPGETWPCYTGGGASGAGVSNLAGVAAVQAVDLYMADPGNATTIGHRRWILSDWIGSTGFGSTNGWSCMQVVSGYGGSGGSSSWIAWPPPGYYPMELHYVAYQTIDQTGWTIQTNGISINDATAQVTENGQDKPVDSILLAGNYGSAGAIKITPQGWKIQAGASYEVTVIGASQDIQYSFEAVDCSELMSP